jgi:hypothetical protein
MSTSSLSDAILHISRTHVFVEALWPWLVAAVRPPL